MKPVLPFFLAISLGCIWVQSGMSNPVPLTKEQLQERLSRLNKLKWEEKIKKERETVPYVKMFVWDKASSSQGSAYQNKSKDSQVDVAQKKIAASKTIDQSAKHKVEIDLVPKNISGSKNKKPGGTLLPIWWQARPDSAVNSSGSQKNIVNTGLKVYICDDKPPSQSPDLKNRDHNKNGAKPVGFREKTGF